MNAQMDFSRDRPRARRLRRTDDPPRLNSPLWPIAFSTAFERSFDNRKRITRIGRWPDSALTFLLKQRAVLREVDLGEPLVRFREFSAASGPGGEHQQLAEGQDCRESQEHSGQHRRPSCHCPCGASARKRERERERENEREMLNSIPNRDRMSEGKRPPPSASANLTVTVTACSRQN